MKNEKTHEKEESATKMGDLGKIDEAEDVAVEKLRRWWPIAATMLQEETKQMQAQAAPDPVESEQLT